MPSSALKWCFVAMCVFLWVLVMIAAVRGQEHPFPFKTLEDITTGTPAWMLDGPPEWRACGTPTEGTIVKFQFRNGAGSVWVVYTDGVFYGAAYFPPDQPVPVAVSVGRIQDGKAVIPEMHAPYDPALHRPCDRWRQNPA